MEDDISAFLAAGADIVLTKPLRFDTLLTLLLFIASSGNTSDPTIKYKLKGDHFEQIENISHLKKERVGHRCSSKTRASLLF